MEYLPVEEEKLLKELKNKSKDKRASSVITGYLDKPTNLTTDRQTQVLESLFEKGYLQGSRVGNSIRFGDLTPVGRSYFVDKRREQTRRWGPAIIGGILGILGTIGGTILGWWLAHLG